MDEVTLFFPIGSLRVVVFFFSPLVSNSKESKESIILVYLLFQQAQPEYFFFWPGGSKVEPRLLCDASRAQTHALHQNVTRDGAACTERHGHVLSAPPPPNELFQVTRGQAG